MINLEELKPILEPLISERDDASAIIESIQALDKDVEFDRTEIDKEWNERFKRAFFGDKGATMKDEPPKDEPEEVNEPEDEEEEIKVDDLFVEEKEED